MICLFYDSEGQRQLELCAFLLNLNCTVKVHVTAQKALVGKADTVLGRSSGFGVPGPQSLKSPPPPPLPRSLPSPRAEASAPLNVLLLARPRASSGVGGCSRKHTSPPETHLSSRGCDWRLGSGGGGWIWGLLFPILHDPIQGTVIGSDLCGCHPPPQDGDLIPGAHRALGRDVDPWCGLSPCVCGRGLTVPPEQPRCSHEVEHLKPKRVEAFFPPRQPTIRSRGAAGRREVSLPSEDQPLPGLWGSWCERQAPWVGPVQKGLGVARTQHSQSQHGPRRVQERV